MKRNKVLTYLLFLLLPLAVGGLAALVTYHGMPVYEQLEKPVFTPPSFLFPIVWNLLYVLMGIGAARVWLSQDPMRGQRLRPPSAALFPWMPCSVLLVRFRLSLSSILPAAALAIVCLRRILYAWQASRSRPSC